MRQAGNFSRNYVGKGLPRQAWWDLLTL